MSDVTPLDYQPAPSSFFQRWRLRIRELGTAGVLYVASVAIPPIGMVVLLSQLNRLAEPLRTHAWGPAVCSISFMLLGGCALLPTAVLAVFAGWAFGFAVGYPVAVLGFVGAALLGFVGSRRLCGGRVAHAIDASERWRLVHRALLGGREAKSFLLITLLRVPSIPPFALTSVILGTLHVGLRPFLLGTCVGVLPRTAAYALLASKAQRLDYSVGQGWQMLAIWGGLTLLVLAVMTFVARRAIHRLTAQPADSISPTSAL